MLCAGMDDTMWISVKASGMLTHLQIFLHQQSYSTQQHNPHSRL